MITTLKLFVWIAVVLQNFVLGIGLLKFIVETAVVVTVYVLIVLGKARQDFGFLFVLWICAIFWKIAWPAEASFRSRSFVFTPLYWPSLAGGPCSFVIFLHYYRVLVINQFLCDASDRVWSSLDSDSVDRVGLGDFCGHKLHFINGYLAYGLGRHTHLVYAWLVQWSIKILIKLNRVSRRVFARRRHLHLDIFLMPTAHELVRSRVPWVVLGWFPTWKTPLLVGLAHSTFPHVCRRYRGLRHRRPNPIRDNSNGVVVLEHIKASWYILIGEVYVFAHFSLLL